MIIRKQEIKKTAEEVSLQVSFGLPDVKRAMQKFDNLLADRCGNTYATNAPLTELDVLHFLEHDTFANFVQKYREQLSSWAFTMAIRHKFLLSSEDDNETKKYYFLSEKLRHKVGRPRELDDED